MLSLQNNNITISGVTHTTQHETIFLSCNDDTLNDILEDTKYVERFLAGDPVVKHSGNVLEPMTYEFQLLSDADFMDIPNRITVYSSDMDALYSYKQGLTFASGDLTVKEELKGSFAEQPSVWERIPIDIRQSIPYVLLLNVVLVVELLLSFTFLQKNIGVLKLQGVSSFKIMAKDLVNTILSYATCLFVISLLSLLYVYVDAGVLLYLQPIFIYMGIQILLFIMMFSMLWYLIYKSSILISIKNGIGNFGLLWINVIIKIIIIVILAIVVAQMFLQTLLLYGEVQTSKNILNTTQNTAKIEYIQGDINLSHKELGDLFFETINALEESNSLYIDATKFEYDYEPITAPKEAYDMTLMFLNAMRVNEKFMKTFETCDKDNTLIEISDKTRTTNPYVFIPVSQWDENKIQELKKDMRYRVFTYVKIKDNQEVFSFDAKAGIQNHGYINNAVFVVDGNYDTQHYLINLNDVRGNTIDEKFHNWFEEHNILDVYSYTEPADMIENVIRDVSGSLIQSAIQIILLFIAIMVVVYQFLAMYLIEHKKKIFVYRTLGVSMFNRYDNLVIMHLINYVVAIILLIVLNQWLAVVFAIIICICDSCISLFILMKLEAKCIMVSLKGGN